MNPLRTSMLWVDCGRRYFVTPADADFKRGVTAIVDATGERRSVDLTSVEQFEVTEQDALRWVREELGATLDKLKAGIDEVLAEARRQVDERNHAPVGERTTVTAEAGPALLGLLGKLPSVIGNSLSGDEQRVGEARATLAALQLRLRDAGIKLDDQFTGFAHRLAELREQPRPRP